MRKLTTKFIPALFAIILVGTPLPAVSQNASTAKTDCVTSPGSNTPEGQHWYYRVRGGKRCWFLGEADERAAKSTRTTGQKSSSSTPHPARDAHAQLASPHPDTNSDTTAPIPAQNETQSQQVTEEAAPNDADLQPTPNQPPPEQLAQQPSPAGATLAATDVSAEKSITSLQMLVLIVGGALALAGILVVVYSFGGSRNRVQAKGARRVNWGPMKDNGEAPQAHAATDSRPHIKRSRPLDSTSAPAGATKLTTEARTPHPESSAKRPRTTPTKLDAKAVKPGAETESDEMDIDAITAMLERLAQDGPSLNRPSSATASADFGQSRRARPGVRA